MMLKQTKKMVPLITRDITLVIMSANWFLVSTYLIGIRGGPHRFCQTTCLTQLCGVLDTCLISIQRNNFSFSWPVKHWCLLFAHRAYWNKRSTSEDTWDSHEAYLESSRNPAKSESSNNPCRQYAEPCYTNDNVVGENKISNELSGSHKLLSILWLLKEVCLQTNECQVHPFGPNTSISRQTVSILCTNLQPFPVSPFRSDGRPG